MYNYRGMSLTPAIVEQLLPDLALPDPFRRSELVKVVEEYHLKNGGKDTDKNITSSVKKALSNLQKSGVVEQAGGVKGYWRVLDGTATPSSSSVVNVDSIISSSVPDAEVTVDAEGQISSDYSSTDYDAIEITTECFGTETDGYTSEGSGKGCVYAYYYPAYKELALSNGEDRFAIKVGRSSTRNAAARIKNQQDTSMPETPRLAYLYYTDHPEKIERIIHHALAVNDRKSTMSPGNEWFISNPSEIKMIVDGVIGLGGCQFN